MYCIVKEDVECLEYLEYLEYPEYSCAKCNVLAGRHFQRESGQSGVDSGRSIKRQSMGDMGDQHFLRFFSSKQAKKYLGFLPVDLFH